MQDAVTAIILIEADVSTDSLAKTLKTLDWAREILIADAVGLGLPQMTGMPDFVQLPLIGFYGELLRYRAALTARGSYLLFVSPGDRVTPSVQEAIRQIYQQNQSATGGYALPREVLWHDLAWRESAGQRQPDLVQREAFLQDTLSCNRQEVALLDIPLQHVVDAEGLFQRLRLDASREAQQRVFSFGLPKIRQDMMISWGRETLGRGVWQGILQGQLFRGHAQRLALFITLIRVHLTWFFLYGYVRNHRAAP